MSIESILKDFDNLKGQFVITIEHTIERLVAIGDDEFDYYYVTFDGRDFNFHTCVGRIMPLKGHLRKKDYNELVRLAKLNHYDFIDACIFNDGFNKWKDQLPDKNTFRTEFCFDLYDEE